MISCLCCFAIGIYALVAGSVRKLERYIGCYADLPRMYKPWSTLDQLFKDLDQLLCSSKCPCLMNDYTKYTYLADPICKIDLDENYVFNDSRINDIPVYRQSVDNCDGYEEIVYAYSERLTGYVDGTDDSEFNMKKFRSYWKRIENKFQCTGFCNTVYLADDNTKFRKMSKYLFNDIDNGIPKYSGCMIEIMKYLKNYLISFGSLALGMGVLFGILSYIIISLGNIGLNYVKTQVEEEE